MAICKRCSTCRTDNRLSQRKCTKCLTLLSTAKYRVKIKNSSTGKWITQTTTTLSKARKLEASVKAGQSSGTTTPTRQSPHNIAAEQGPAGSLSFDAYYSYAKITKKSHRNDLEYWKKHVRDHDYMTTQGIIKILGRLKDKGLAPATVKLVLGFIKRFYNWHIENGLWDGPNPASKIRLPKFDNRVSQPLTLAEAARLLEYLETHPNRPMALMVSLALLTGRRQGELLGLWRDDVDLGNGGAAIAALLNSCSLTLPVIGKIQSTSEPFTGTATGYMDGSGDLSVTLQSGVSCNGHFVYKTSRDGEGIFNCEDGRSGPFQFVSTGTRGTGHGNLGGETFTFTFGEF